MRFTLLLTLSILAGCLYGQTDSRGKFYLSGNTSLQYATNFGGGINQGQFEASQLGFFLSNRFLLGAEVAVDTQEGLYEGSNFIISPFLRYYLPNQAANTPRFFGEVGFGSFGNFGFGSSFETNFYLGVGAEQDFGDGVVGTARLRYRAVASGLNFTELDLGLNVLLGGPTNWDGFGTTARKGSLLIDPRLGSIGFGFRGRNNTQEVRLDLNLELGYFLSENVLAEAGLQTESFDYSRDATTDFNEYRWRNWEAFAGLRYFLPLPTTRLQPYVLGRVGLAGFSSASNLSSFGPLETKDSSPFIEAGGGALYFLTKKVAIDANLRYRGQTEGVNYVRFTSGLKVLLGKQ